jgi:hypothetical protein
MKNKKLAGLDDISPYLLKKYAPHMIKPLSELVNASIREGIFPSTLKQSVVNQFTKKGQKKMQTIVQLLVAPFFEIFWKK